MASDNKKLSVLMLMPGSGLGSAFVGQDGLPLTGQTLCALETAHMIAPLHLLGLTGKTFPCGCGKDWGCVEAYTTISGLPYLLAEKLIKYPGHELAKSAAPIKEKVLRSAPARKRVTRWRWKFSIFRRVCWACTSQI